MVDSVSGSVVKAGDRTFVAGLGSGIDFTSLIQAAYDQKVARADRIEVKVDANQAKINAYDELRSLASALQTSVSGLTRSYDLLGQATNVFDDRTGAISYSGVGDPLSFIDVAVEPGADLSDYDIEVVNVGDTQKVLSDGANGTFADITSAAGKGSATFELGLVGGPTETISFDNNSSLQDIVNSINAVTATTNVSASIISLDGGASYQFVLGGTEAGADFQFVDTSGDDGFELLGITDAGDAYVNELQPATQSQITFEGIPITQNSNTYDSLIQGVEFTVKNETAGNTLNISIANDVALVREQIEDFIEAYNALRDFVIQNQQVSAAGTVAEGAELFSDSILEGLSREVQGLVGTNFTTAAGFETLRELGIEFDTANKLSIADATALDDALLNNFQSVRQLFETQSTIDNSELRIQANKSVTESLSFALDITHDGSGITSVSVGGDTSLFTIAGNTIKGAVGSIYEGLSLAYVGNTSTTVNVDIQAGFADLLNSKVDRYANSVTGSIIQESLRLEDRNGELNQEIDDIVTRAEKYRDAEIDRLARLEAQISQAQILIDQIKAIVNAGNDD